MPKFYTRASKIIFIFALIIRVLFTLNRALNADEFQHLHNAWMIHLGFLPYRDFWDNHTPFLHYFIAPLLGVLGEGSQTVIMVRIFVSFCSLAILIPVYQIARGFIDAETGWITVALLTLSEIFMQKTIEVRPDFGLTLFFLFSLWCCLRTPSRYLLGGLLLGIAALFSPKALISLAAALIFLPFAQQPVNFRMWMKRVFEYSFGFVIPIACLAAYFFSQNAFAELLRCTLLENLSYPDTHRPMFLLLPQNVVLLLLSFAGMWVWFRRNGIKHPLSILFAIGMLLFVLLAFVMPAPYSQSALMFLPIFAIGAGYAIAKSSGVLRVLAIAAGVVPPIVSIVIANPVAKSNEPQFALMNYVLQNSNEDATIFDGNAVYIFRKQAYYYGSLVEGIRQRIRDGNIQRSIPESLSKQHCRIVIDDDRVSDLPADIQNYLRSNYTSSEYSSVYVAGKNLVAENITGNHATFTIDLPMKYKVETSSQDFRIDGRTYTSPVLLTRGNHRIDADADLTYVKIRAM